MNTLPNRTINDDCQIGVVYRKSRDFFILSCEDRFLTCQLSASLRKSLDGGKSKFDPHDRIAVGDKVRCVFSPGAYAQIVEVLPRRNWLSRRSAVPMPGALASEQLIAANVDLVIPVFAAVSPAPKWNLLDRYLAAASAAGIPALICLTKIDQMTDDQKAADELREVLDDYERIGYPLIRTSSVSGEGLPNLKENLQGKTSLLLGKSGVGKTSLLNALEPGLGQKVSEISKFNRKGRHTTSVAEMFALAAGGALIDTPGVREFGLWDVDVQDLALYFPEMEPLIGKCKFGLGCSHDEEPGCAIRKAVLDGRVSPRRYASYLRLAEEP